MTDLTVTNQLVFRKPVWSELRKQTLYYCYVNDCVVVVVERVHNVNKKWGWGAENTGQRPWFDPGGG